MRHTAWHDCDMQEVIIASITSQARFLGTRLRWLGHSQAFLWATVVLSVIAVPLLLVFLMSSSPVPRSGGVVYTPSMVIGHDFAAADLRGTYMTDLDLRGKDFQRADAAGAVLAGSFLSGADFSRANLRGADLRGTCLRGANLTGAELVGTDFTGADVTDVTVTSSALAKAIGWSSTAPSSACSDPVGSGGSIGNW